jgi:hypothetical protein
MGSAVQRPIRGSQPQCPIRILVHGRNRFRDRAEGDRVEPVALEALQSVHFPHPQHSIRHLRATLGCGCPRARWTSRSTIAGRRRFRIDRPPCLSTIDRFSLLNGPNIGVLKARNSLESTEATVLENREARARPNPQATGAVDEQHRDDLVGECRFILRIECRELCAVETCQAFLSADPQKAVRVRASACADVCGRPSGICQLSRTYWLGMSEGFRA